MRMYDLMYGALGPQRWWPGDTLFEIAVGAVLTQNTNWSNVERAIGNLKRARALSARRIHAMPHDELAGLIKPSGYFNVKARRLKAFVDHLVRGHGGSMGRMGRGGLPELRGALLGINGIGPETADSILLYALGKPVFVVDAYTKRIFSRHGLMGKEEGYEAYQGMFHAGLPGRDVALYNEYHALIVMVGKGYCRPRGPRCADCPLLADSPDLAA